MARLYKIHSDGSAEFKEQGARVQAIAWNEDRTFKEVVAHVPTVGCSLLVGSVTARSYSDQDYWLTTKVTEILVESAISIKFKTENSTYELIF
jgi:hypothetical protein